MKIEYFKPNGDQSPALCYAAKSAWLKLKKWYGAANTEVLAVSAILDPRFKLDFFKNTLRWPDIWVKGIHKKVTWGWLYRQSEVHMAQIK